MGKLAPWDRAGKPRSALRPIRSLRHAPQACDPPAVATEPSESGKRTPSSEQGSTNAATPLPGPTAAQPEASFGQLLRNYRRSMPPGRLFKVFLEEYLGTLIRSWPGVEGFAMRYGLYKLIFKRLDGFCYLYPGARLSHAYGIAAGRNLMVNGGAFLYGRGGLEIGDHVMIGPNAVIVSSQHRFDDPRVPMAFLGHIEAPVTIGSDVWIGANAVVLPGVRIADHTVVSAGAVVTHDTEPWSIVGGIPARRIGERPRLPEASSADSSAAASAAIQPAQGSC